MQIKSAHTVDVFEGTLTEYKDIREVPDGYTPDSLNWVTQTNKQGIELRRGTKRLGLTKLDGAGAITGLGVGRRFDGVEVPFYSHGRKLKYYDATTDDTVECGTDILPTTADGEAVSIEPYQNLAGSWVYASSRNSSIFKIPTANPGSVVDQLSTNYRGFFKFGQSRGFLFDRNGDTPGNNDKMGLYASAVDKVSLTQYPAQTTGEAYGTGDGLTLTYTHTLTGIAAKKTAMFVLVTGSTETFVDDRSGNLIGNHGGTGTINYATGQVSVTFITAPSGAITCSYYLEDATNRGVADFSIADPSNRVPGEGNYFPQFDAGGPLRSVFSLATVFYCFHQLKTWQVSIPVDDESGTDSITTNLPFREKMGVKSNYGAYGGEQGTYLINTADENKPEFLRLELYAGATAANIAQPKPLSKLIDFSGFAFDHAVVYEWGEYVLLCCQQFRNGVPDNFNSRMFVYNKKSGVWDMCDNPASRLSTYGGTLLAGDPITNNVFTLFSGFDDDDNIINNYWTTGSTDLGMPGQKRFGRMRFEGLIQPSQRYAVDFAFDGGDFLETFIVEGAGSYVDTGRSIAVGTNTVGSKIVGGGSEVVYANPYRVEFRVQSGRFEHIRMRVRALAGGYLSIHKYEYVDIRQKAGRALPERLG